MSELGKRVLRYMDRVEAGRLVRVADVRDENRETLFGYDLFARKQPRRMGGLTYATLCAQAGVGFREVPSEFWTLTTTDDGFPSAEVACQCGSTPNPEALATVVECDGCERWFFFDGVDVWVFNSPKKNAVASGDNATTVPS